MGGKQRFRPMVPLYYRRVRGILLTYDVTNRKSFESLSDFIKDIKTLTNKKVKIVLIGNKIDLISKREVEIEEAQKFAKENEIPLFMECSAKNSTNISEIFHSIIEYEMSIQSLTNPTTTKFG
jgi:small GTP-binding protein